ncbi:pimeloyl-ACP methyl ester carboxylesterase [Variovorax paradoxus]|uniref:Pimeloyl-ACP methyl ester carboxylesterase n=1 Tax=Variovorax paradoxus TaxID=34073 RepID=A0AAW8E826_VARPD|nr:alpha/beta hydrolase [Variovorax paradoxus]MDP9968923.1 pimeloyl-ACP methyl ester carboxylesterase [Variovorax paradoxus]
MQPQLKELSVLGSGGFRRLAYAEWGSRHAARTIVCVHGVSRTGRDFDVLAQALVEQGARVIAPDLPGRGRSEWLASAAHYTDGAYTSAMGALIARLDVEQVDWIGTSLGGHIGMMLAAEQATPIRRLVLNDFGARLSAAALRRIGGYLTRSWNFESIEALEVHLRDALAPFGNLSDAQWRDLSLHSAVPDPSGGLRFHFDPAIGARFAIPIWLDVVLWTLWDKIECPVLVLRGEDSDLLSSDTVDLMLRRGLAAKAGKVTAIEIAGCGHAPALLDAQQVAAVQKFLFGDRPTARGRAAAPTRLRAGRQPEASTP